ncbi:ABC transporter substrate-binding protein [Streptomyces sp. NBC_00075]|uniref:ABC transporter substrate-binding protein n=1 Tax=Streptomyces sp. NBC_00075 TaxID=2975641 RepID=UPI00324E1FA8
MTRRPHRPYLPVLVAGLALVASACGKGDAGTAGGGQGGGGKYKVGLSLSLTGPAAAVGRDFKSAFEVFREVAPEAKGLKLEFVVCDDRSTPDGAAACARKLTVQQRVDIVFGPLLAGTYAGAAPVLKRAQVVSIEPSPYVRPDPGTPIFATAARAEDADRRTLEFAKKSGAGRLGVLATTDVSGESAVENVRTIAADLGLKVDIERMGPADVDATAQLNSLTSKKPDMLYIPAPGAASAVALKGLKQLGVDLPTALNWANTTNEFLTAAKTAFPSEVYYAGLPAWLPDELEDSKRGEQARRFQQAFQKRTGKPVSMAVQNGYAGFQVLALTLKNTGGRRAEAVKYLESLHGFQSLDWKISYSSSDHTLRGEYGMFRYDATTGRWSTATEAGA